jgi:hypothetical protein
MVGLERRILRVLGVVLSLCGVMTVLVLAAAGLQHANAAGSATIQVTPASSYIAAGETQDVHIEIKDLTVGLGTYQIRLSYDETILELVGVANASFLGSTGRLVSCADESVPGEVHLRCNTSQSSLPGATGSGQLAQIRFKALVNGDSPLYFAPCVRCLEPIGIGEGFGDTIEISDYGEGVIRVGDSPPDDGDDVDGDGDGDGGSGNGGGGGGGDGGGERAPTPTKIPGALSPAVVPNAQGTPEAPLEDDVYNPACAGAGSCVLPSGVAGSSTGGGSSSGGSSSGSGATTDGAGAPVAGYGPQGEEERIPGAALRTLVLGGGLLVLLGVFIARRNQGGLR